MARSLLVALLVIAISVDATTAIAGIRSGILLESFEAVQRKFGGEIVEEFGEGGSTVLARKMDSLAAKHGTELVAEATRKVGPRLFRYVEEIGEDGSLAALKLMSRHGGEAIWVISKPGRFSMFVKYGDDAADAMIKHGEISETLISQYGRSGARAMSAVNGRSARRIAMMEADGDLAELAQPFAVLDVVGRYGDRAADWTWTHKGALVVTSVATAFVTDPEPFLEGAVEVVRIGSQYVIRPVVETAAQSINWNLWLPLFGLIVAAWVVIKRRRRRLVAKG